MIVKIFPFKTDAIDLLEIFKEEKGLSFLHSSQIDSIRGRFSFFGFDPFLTVRETGEKSLDILKKKFLPFKSSQPTVYTPLPAGMMGFISYDYGLYGENIKSQIKKEYFIPDVAFGFYDAMITVDHLAQKMIISSSGLPETNHLRHSRAKSRYEFILRKLIKYQGVFSLKDQRVHRETKDLKFKSNFTKAQYIRAIQRALEHIRQGDIYQVNLSQRFLFDLKKKSIDPVLLYHKLMQFSPSSFSGYVDYQDFKIISSSPERFLQLTGNRIETRPMKGTRPRGKTKQQDSHFRKEIIQSKKERAELLMITDLERNDLGRVCDYASVKVKDMRTIEKYKTVYQATSTVVGQLKKGMDGFDLIEATFPGGSVTGCPKIRAMEIIDKIETVRRGIYTGSLGYMNFNGDLDFNILIRTILLHRNKAYVQVGGGIVADSNPEQEYQETLVKAQAMKDCLKETLFA